MHNIEVNFWYGIYLYYDYFVDKMGNFHFVLVRIVVHYENLLNLKFFAIYFEKFLNSAFRFCCFWSIYIVVIMFCKIISMLCLLFV